MASRDKLRDAAAPYLQPGERVDQVILAQANASPWLYLGFAFGLVGVVAAAVIKPLIIAVTDQSIIVLQGSRFRATRAKALLARLPRHTRLGPAPGRLWSKVEVAGQRLWIPGRFRPEVEAADAALPEPPPDAGPPPERAPPEQPAPEEPVAGQWPLEGTGSRNGQWALRVVAAVASVLLVASLVAATDERDAASPSGKGSFLAADGRFRAGFPGDPTRATQTERVADVELTTVLYRRDVGLDRSYIVSFVDFPYPLPNPTDALVGAANGVALAGKGEMISATPTTHGGRQAVEAVMTIGLDAGTADTHYAKALFVLDGLRLYNVSVFDKDNPPGGYDDFIESFEVVGA